MAGYGNSEESIYDPEGLVLVWNSKYKTTTPEFVWFNTVLLYTER